MRPGAGASVGGVLYRGRRGFVHASFLVVEMALVNVRRGSRMAWEPNDPWCPSVGADSRAARLNKAHQRWHRRNPALGLPPMVLLVAAGLGLAQSIFTVDPDEEGLVKRIRRRGATGRSRVSPQRAVS